jgi:transposase
MDYVSESLKLIYLCMGEQLFAGSYLQVDETPIKYLEPGSGKAQQGYFWAYSNPKGDVLFDWQPGRGHECLLEMLKKPNQSENSKDAVLYYQGIIQCDGYSAYGTLARKITGITLAGCWAHVRRKFNDAAKHSPALANWIIKQIQHLYQIEKKAGPRLRHSVRQSESRPIVARIKKALMIYKARPSILPQSTLGMAVEYALGQWVGLEVYLTDGRVEIDNNLVENAIRPTAIGKKNWLFIGRVDTGERSAIIYSIIESCRRRGIDPHAYLTDVLERIPDAKTSDIKNLTPEAWARSRPRLAAAA